MPEPTCRVVGHEAHVSGLILGVALKYFLAGYFSSPRNWTKSKMSNIEMQYHYKESGIGNGRHRTSFIQGRGITTSLT